MVEKKERLSPLNCYIAQINHKYENLINIFDTVATC